MDPSRAAESVAFLCGAGGPVAGAGGWGPGRRGPRGHKAAFPFNLELKSSFCPLLAVGCLSVSVLQLGDGDSDLTGQELKAVVLMGGSCSREDI